MTSQCIKFVENRIENSHPRVGLVNHPYLPQPLHMGLKATRIAVDERLQKTAVDHHFEKDTNVVQGNGEHPHPVHVGGLHERRDREDVIRGANSTHYDKARRLIGAEKHVQRQGNPQDTSENVNANAQL